MSDYPHGHEAHVGYRCDLCDAPTPHTDTDTGWLDSIIEQLLEDEKLKKAGRWYSLPMPEDKAKQAITKAVADARISELKQLEPPEQYEEYAKLMGSEHCRICGFNATEFRKYIKHRIQALKRKERS